MPLRLYHVRYINGEIITVTTTNVEGKTPSNPPHTYKALVSTWFCLLERFTSCAYFHVYLFSILPGFPCSQVVFICKIATLRSTAMLRSWVTQLPLEVRRRNNNIYLFARPTGTRFDVNIVRRQDKFHVYGLTLKVSTGNHGRPTTLFPLPIYRRPFALPVKKTSIVVP